MWKAIIIYEIKTIAEKEGFFKKMKNVLSVSISCPTYLEFRDGRGDRKNLAVRIGPDFFFEISRVLRMGNNLDGDLN